MKELNKPTNDYYLTRPKEKYFDLYNPLKRIRNQMKLSTEEFNTRLNLLKELKAINMYESEGGGYSVEFVNLKRKRNKEETEDRIFALLHKSDDMGLDDDIPKLLKRNDFNLKQFFQDWEEDRYKTFEDDMSEEMIDEELAKIHEKDV